MDLDPEVRERLAVIFEEFRSTVVDSDLGRYHSYAYPFIVHIRPLISVYINRRVVERSVPLCGFRDTLWTSMRYQLPDYRICRRCARIAYLLTQQVNQGTEVKDVG